MRFVTLQWRDRYRSGLIVPNGDVLDLKLAYNAASAAGLSGFASTHPIDLIEIISSGAPMIESCQALLDAWSAGKLDAATIPIEKANLAAPIARPRKNIFCVGSNYRAHVTEASRAQSKQDKVPDYPVFFTKPPTSIVGPNELIEIDARVSEMVDYEVELGVVIGKAGRNISQANAIDHIFGFTIINDVSARDIQRRHGGQFLKGKGMDSFCPMGPEIVTLDELLDFDNLTIGLTVNGEVRQNGNTSSMIFSIPKLLESLSEGMTLEPGDVLATGTPSGVGYAMDPPVFLQDGDVVTCKIEGIGTLSNSVRQLSRGTVAA